MYSCLPLDYPPYQLTQPHRITLAKLLRGSQRHLPKNFVDCSQIDALTMQLDGHRTPPRTRIAAVQPCACHQLIKKVREACTRLVALPVPLSDAKAKTIAAFRQKLMRRFYLPVPHPWPNQQKST